MDAGTKTLTAADILGAPDVRIEPVDVPEWGGRVYVRDFSAAQREQFDEMLTAGADDEGEDGDEVKTDTRNIRCRVLALTVCDASGNPLFTAEQAVQLASKSDVAVYRVWDVAARLNKLRRKDREAEKKESAPPPSGASPTA